MIKKISALILVLLLSLGLAACSQQDPDAPEDMHSVTLKGEPFILYVPVSWTANTASGVSGAYASSSQKIMVTARASALEAAVEATEAEAYLTAYLTDCAETYATVLPSFEKVKIAKTALAAQTAARLDFTFLENEVEMSCFQIAVLYKSDLISLCGYCPTDVLESNQEDFDKIIASFVLCDRTDPQGAELVDSDTPDGMEIASGKNTEYRLYVPKAWICDAESGVSEAYFSESDRSNVLVTSYVPDEALTIADYFASCEADYKKTLPEYTRVGESKTTVAGKDALSYTYTTVVDGVAFKIQQTLFYHSETIYSFTYTARADLFDSHLTDVQRMLDVFCFR